MKKTVPLLAVVIFFMLGNITWSQCPEDPDDHGICDTIYVEPWPADTLPEGVSPYFVRVPIYVTNDVVDSCDSISGFCIPLCYRHSNPSKYCSVSGFWNTDYLQAGGMDRSIFRDMPGVENWMWALAQSGPGAQWGNIILHLDGTSYFWLMMSPTTQQYMWDVSRALIATMTFRVEDTMTICIDTCLWPPGNRIAFAYGPFGRTAVPRLGTPHSLYSYEVCFNRGGSGVREIQGSEDSRPSEFFLSCNYPNPFNPVMNLQFSLPRSAQVKIEIFNIVGQKVRTLVDQDVKPGVYVVDWDGRDEKGNFVSSGIYFYRMQAGDFSDMKKMVLVK